MLISEQIFKVTDVSSAWLGTRRLCQLAEQGQGHAFTSAQPAYPMGTHQLQQCSPGCVDAFLACTPKCRCNSAAILSQMLEVLSLWVLPSQGPLVRVACLAAHCQCNFCCKAQCFNLKHATGTLEHCQVAVSYQLPGRRTTTPPHPCFQPLTTHNSRRQLSRACKADS